MLTGRAAEPVLYRPAEEIRDAQVGALDGSAARLALAIVEGRYNAALLHGDPGTGKSFAMRAIVSRLNSNLGAEDAERGALVWERRERTIWVDWPEACEDTERWTKMRTDDRHRFEPFLFLQNYRGGLAIDDLGVEVDRFGNYAAAFDRIVARRVGLLDLPLLITTNIDVSNADAFTTRFGARAYSRLVGRARLVHFAGVDRRVTRRVTKGQAS